jgi:hypothetical protein
MAWYLTIEPEFQPELDWAVRFVRGNLKSLAEIEDHFDAVAGAKR